jgi:hypothetical protein
MLPNDTAVNASFTASSLPAPATPRTRRSSHPPGSAIEVGLQVDPQVVSELADRDEPAAPSLGHGRGAAPGEDRSAVVSAEKRRREVEDVPVDEAVSVELVRDLRATLDEELQDAAATELVENGAERAVELYGRMYASVGRCMSEHHAKGLWSRQLPGVVAHGQRWVVRPHCASPD